MYLATQLSQYCSQYCASYIDRPRSDLNRCLEALEKVKEEFALVQTRLEAMLEVISGYCCY